MLAFIRISSISVGIGTALPVLTGAMAYPMFVVPDLILGALMILAALVPPPRAGLALGVANGFSMGIYSVALANQLTAPLPISPLLIVVMVAVAANLILLARMRAA